MGWHVEVERHARVDCSPARQDPSAAERDELARPLAPWLPTLLAWLADPTASPRVASNDVVQLVVTSPAGADELHLAREIRSSAGAAVATQIARFTADGRARPLGHEVQGVVAATGLALGTTYDEHFELEPGLWRAGVVETRRSGLATPQAVDVTRVRIEHVESFGPVDPASFEIDALPGVVAWLVR